MANQLELIVHSHGVEDFEAWYVGDGGLLRKKNIIIPEQNVSAEGTFSLSMYTLNIQ